ncbi:MAG: hypothetical protein WBD31_27895, partial [Rubripirellula sp.]
MNILATTTSPVQVQILTPEQIVETYSEAIDEETAREESERIEDQDEIRRLCLYHLRCAIVFCRRVYTVDGIVIPEGIRAREFSQRLWRFNRRPEGQSRSLAAYYLA